MKLICTVLNVIALFTVLFLGSVSAHAEGAEHSHRQITHASKVAADLDYVELQDDTPSPREPAMHCGAPIIGPEQLRIDCAIRVTEVDFYPEAVHVPSDSLSDNLRPPRS